MHQQVNDQIKQLSLHTTGYIYHKIFDKHFRPNVEFPENPKRTQFIDKTILTQFANHPQFESFTDFHSCSKENILLAHTEEYFDFIDQQVIDPEKGENYYEIPDAYMNEHSAMVSRVCVQGVLIAVDKVLNNKWNNAFCSVRPPGHHSGHVKEPNGFCIYNNVAIAAKYARKNYGIQKIVILDWDVHHCDGTESIFYDDANTLVISIHRYDNGQFYPNSGSSERIGIEKGKHYNINLGWNIQDNTVPGFDEYIYAYDRVFHPIIQEFKPDFIIISAGYDSAKGDPLGEIDNTPEGYQYITQKLMSIQPKLIAVLEGGYNNQVTAECALATVKTLMGEQFNLNHELNPNFVGIRAVDETLFRHENYWKCLLSNDLIQMQIKLKPNNQMVQYISSGHILAFELMGNKLLKKAKQTEIDFYTDIQSEDSPYYQENQLIKKFIPSFYQITDTGVIMENLLHDMKNPCVLDLKIGFKTYDPNTSQVKKVKDDLKQALSGQGQTGMRVVGVIERDQDGQIKCQLNGSQAYKQYNSADKIGQLILTLLKSQTNIINMAALQDMITLISGIIEFIKISKRYYRKTSILLVIDNSVQKHNVRWIDFAFVKNLKEDIDEPNNEFDKNVHGGLKIQQLDLNPKITGFINSPDFLNHHCGQKKHPENPKRTQCIDKTIKEYLKDKNLNVEDISQFGYCTKEDILLVHPESYFDFVEEQFMEIEGMKTKDVIFITDTYTNKQSAITARKCVQGVLMAVDKIFSNQWRNAFCSVRPPGHHSGHKTRPNGFCIYNNVAIAARYAQQKYGAQKIVIFDWDVHHCDGTESIFYEDPDILVISIHRYDNGKFYPNSGTPERIGEGKGAFKQVNIGWNIDDNEDDDDEKADIPGYDDYVYAYERLLGPIISSFKPDFILISAGYDSAKGDIIGGIRNTPLGYQYMTEQLMKQCPKVLAVLEGGYSVDITAQCALATFQSLLGEKQKYKDNISPTQCGLKAVTSTVDKQKEYWKCLIEQNILDYEKKYLGKVSDFITGGHLQSFTFSEDVLIKQTKKGEINFYLSLIKKDGPFKEENIQIEKWVPKIIEVNELQKKIKMENLTFGLEQSSIIDLKMGFKTYDPNGPEIKRTKELKKAQQCEQTKLGFRVAGLKVRDNKGDLIINKNGSIAYTTITNALLVRDSIIAVLKSNGRDLNFDALQEAIKLVDEVAAFVKTSKRFFRNTSILIIVDNMVNKYQIRWIDMNYVYPLDKDIESPNEPFDNNLYQGLINLSQMLQSI